MILDRKRYFCIMNFLATYRKDFDTYLEEYVAVHRSPESLYTPVKYILGLGGKRLRPILTLMTASIFRGDLKKALPAALAVEVFHNFSLIHDDIMDEAPLRRGKKTVHEKWDLNTGILSGDAMLIQAYQLFENYEPTTFNALARLFSKTALEVCEGQQFDIDFETRNDVTIDEYLKMIEYKTAVLVGASMKMGAIVAKASKNCCDAIYQFGKNLGIAFQLQDDYLDAFGNPETFGKQVGGDILENKKTFLVLKALKMGDKKDVDTLNLLLNSTEKSESKIQQVKAIFDRSGASEATREAVEEYTLRAYNALNELQITDEHKSQLIAFGDYLMQRTK